MFKADSTPPRRSDEDEDDDVLSEINGLILNDCNKEKVVQTPDRGTCTTSHNNDATPIGKRVVDRRASLETMQARYARGECPTCGTQVRYKLGGGDAMKWASLSTPGLVRKGRCLLCNPDHLSPQQQEAELPQEHASQHHIQRLLDPSMEVSFETVKDVSSPTSGKLLSTKPTVTLKDWNGDCFVGKVTKGTVEKGRGVFSHVYKHGEFKDKTIVYEGEFDKGSFDGFGTLRGASGCIYIGEFHASRLSGHGRGIWPNGEVYEGEFRNDKRNGMGIKTWINGDGYVGQWKDGKMKGKGKFFYHNGDVYEGDFNNGRKPDGYGEMRYFNGRVLKGTWIKGRFVG